ncbi:MAG: hypothetical protein COA78_06115 [Blastopirellula sp.]|nr:MAG: hypothetical protein COA78_06115 [Blastopirellula sp.]
MIITKSASILKSTLTVSVIIPAYNAESTISRAIASVKMQTYGAHEIIVVDDGSRIPLTDLPLQLTGNTRILRKRQGGVSSARNLGISAATGDLIAFLDADDQWSRERLADAVKVFCEFPEVQLTAGRYFVHETGNYSGNIAGPVLSMTDQTLSLKGSQAFTTAKRISTPTVTIRREALQIDRFDTTLITAEDRDLWIRILMKSQCYLISKPLVVVELRPDSLSHSNIDTDCLCMLSVIHRYSNKIGLIACMKEYSVVHYKWACGIGGGFRSWQHLIKSVMYWPLPSYFTRSDENHPHRCRFFISLMRRTLLAHYLPNT